MALKLLLCLLFVVAVVSATTAPPQALEEPPAPDTGNTTTTETPDAGNSTTTETPDTGNSTATETPDAGNSTTTETPDAGNSTTTTTASPNTTAKPDACSLNPCKGGSTCVNRGNSYECLCLTGDFYDHPVCVAAKVFPGDLTYKETFTDDMADPKSDDFKRVSDKIVAEIDAVYTPKPKSVGYLGSTVTKISKAPKAENIMTRAETILATVDIKFDPQSDIKAEEVKNGVAKVGEFKASDLCKSSVSPCDETAICVNGTEGGFACECKEQYIKTSLSNRICVACAKGKKAVKGVCVGCDFGYTGFNCEDDWQLILVIVGSIFGALLVVTTALIPVVAMKAKKKSKKGKADNVEKSYKNPAHIKPAQTNGSALPRPIPLQTAPVGGRPGYGGNNVPRIPRATANESWERGNLDKVPSNSRQNLIPGRNSRQFEDQDSNPYSRPVKSQNPYSGGRPQTNPYASNQGHSNPYFRNDEGRRY